MMHEGSKDQWISIENCKIFMGGLWKELQPGQPLTELVELTKVQFMGTENGVHIYICEEPPKEVIELFKGELGDDTHVYLGTLSKDIHQGAMLWPY